MVQNFNEILRKKKHKKTIDTFQPSLLNKPNMQLSRIPQLKHTTQNNFFLLSGPCAIEGEEMALRIAEKIVSVTEKLQIPYVFKGSFKKANRSRVDSFTGIGDEKALKILRKVSETF